MQKFSNSRRRFLVTGASLIATFACRSVFIFAGRVFGEDSTSEEKCLGQWQDLKTGVPMAFTYLHEDLGEHVLVKMGYPIAGGVGPDRDIVAYPSQKIPFREEEQTAILLSVRGKKLFAVGLRESSSQKNLLES